MKNVILGKVKSQGNILELIITLAKKWLAAYLSRQSFHQVIHLAFRFATVYFYDFSWNDYKAVPKN